MSRATGPSPPAALRLRPAEVHVWSAGLDVTDAELAQLRQLLSNDEHARATRFVFEQDRRRFAAAHGILRKILARYLGTAPADLVFEIESAGKPQLAHQHGGALHFNLSHSRDLVLIAVTAGADIGVDLERISDTVEVDEVAAIVFSPAEIAVLNRLSPPQKRQAFFNGWTRKEAIVKALGEGLGYPVRQLTVSIAPSERVRLIQAEGETMNGSRWSLQSLPAPTGYVAAVAHRGPRRSLRRFAWSDGSDRFFLPRAGDRRAH